MIATRPADTSADAPAPRHEIGAGSGLGAFVRLLPLFSAGGVMLIGWAALWTLSYRLTHGNDFTYAYLTTHEGVWRRLHDMLLLANRLVPGIEPPQSLDVVVNAMVAGFVVLGLGYLGAVLLLDRGLARVPGAVGVLLGFVALFQVILFTLPGLYTSDLFSYVMYDHIGAVYGLNPYVFPPVSFPENPLLQWIHPFWHNQPTVYGPLWTNLGWVMGRLTESLSILDRVLAYKLLMNGLHVVNLWLVWWLLGRFLPDNGRPGSRVVAFAVFAWNPLMLFEVTGNAHNDALMVTLLLLGLVPVAATMRRGASAAAPIRGRANDVLAWLGGAVVLGLSVLVKYVTGVVVFFYLVAWARRIPTWRLQLAWISGTMSLLVGISALLMLPWLQFPEVLAPILDAAGGKLYTNSLPDALALTISDQVLAPRGMPLFEAQETARFSMKLLTKLLFAGYVAWEAWRLWRRGVESVRATAQAVVRASVRTFLVLLLVVMTWVLAWYFTWPLALATLLGWRSMLCKVVVALTLTAPPVFYYHHYWADGMNALFLLAYAVPPLLLPIGAWLWDQRRRLTGMRSAAPVEQPLSATLPLRSTTSIADGD